MAWRAAALSVGHLLRAEHCGVAHLHAPRGVWEGKRVELWWFSGDFIVICGNHDFTNHNSDIMGILKGYTNNQT